MVLAIMGLFILCLFMILPRRRETARMASCQRNLMQIGTALGLYDQEPGITCRTSPSSAARRPRTRPARSRLCLWSSVWPTSGELTDTTSRPPKRAGLTHEGTACAWLHLRERSERDRRGFPCPGQLPGNHGRRHRRPQRRLRPGPAPQHRADRGGRRFELHGRVLRAARGRQPARTPCAVQLRPRARPASCLGLPPVSAHGLAGRRGGVVGRRQLAIHPLQPCLDPERRALVHRRRPPLGLHGRLERSRGRGQRPLLRSQRADLYSLGRAQDLCAWANVPEAPRDPPPSPQPARRRIPVLLEGPLDRFPAVDRSTGLHVPPAPSAHRRCSRSPRGSGSSCPSRTRGRRAG